MITDDSECEKHFSIVESNFLRPLILSSGRRSWEVIQAEYIVNPKLLTDYKNTKMQFKAAGKPVHERYGFHGTTTCAIKTIFQQGFKIGGKDIECKNGACYGKGVYLAKTPLISKDYSRGETTCVIAQLMFRYFILICLMQDTMK